MGKSTNRRFGVLERPYILPECEIGRYLLRFLDQASDTMNEGLAFYVSTLFRAVLGLFSGQNREIRSVDDWREAFEGNRGTHRDLLREIDFSEFTDIVGRESFNVFDSSVWARRDGDIV